MPTVEELEREVEKLKREKEQERREKEKEKARADAWEQRQAPTRFLDYIRNVEQHLYATFSVEPDPQKTSSVSTTSVEGRFYPQHFQPWTDFAAVHGATFDAFATALADHACFPALNYIESIGQDLSPKVADESGLFPFLRASIEKPAATVVSKYLEFAGHDKFRAVKFHGNSYGMLVAGKSALERPAEEELPAPARKRRRSPVKDIGVPDRWLIAYCHDGTSDNQSEHVLVGEVKPAHVLHGAKLNRVLSGPLGDDFFLRAARQDGASTSGQVPGEVYVAKAFCQAFHYMITTGLEFGYVASGDGLVFLRVLEDDPNTLYYFGSVFPVSRNPDVAAAREPRETAMAHLATLCMLSLASTPRSSSWIDARDGDLKRWPKSKATVPSLAETSFSLPPHDKDGGSGGGSSGSGGSGSGNAGGSAGHGESRPGSQSALKRSRGLSTTGGNSAGSHGAQRTLSTGSFVVEPPTLPYCTQACLRSLYCGRALDTKCPNARLHQAAAGNKDSHALTAVEVRTHVVEQLARNMDKDCKSLLFDGYLGRIGVLFKITVTGFGYTFVAKAVQAVYGHIVQHEAAIYAALDAFQGRLIPVCLGPIDLERPIPLRNCQYVSHMLLMSYAGPDLCSQHVLQGVDLPLEAEKTRQELHAAGLLNDDPHNANCAWNEEVHRVMQFDFDEAYMQVMEEPPAAPRSSPQRSPLQVKRSLNAYHEGNKWNGDGQMKKRVRTAT